MCGVDGLSAREISRRTGLAAIRSRGCWRRPSRRSTSGSRWGQSSTRLGTGSASSLLWILGFTLSGCGRWPAGWLMRAGSRSSMISCGRSARGSCGRGRSSGPSIGLASWCSAICEPGEQVPVGHGQRRRGWVVTCEVCWPRAIAGTLIFSNGPPDVLWGLARNLHRLGALPEKLVWASDANWKRQTAAPGRGRDPAVVAL
jgi:hypothetical protein